jgi:hypothetical protein
MSRDHVRTGISICRFGTRYNKARRCIIIGKSPARRQHNDFQGTQGFPGFFQEYASFLLGMEEMLHGVGSSPSLQMPRARNLCPSVRNPRGGFPSRDTATQTKELNSTICKHTVRIRCIEFNEYVQYNQTKARPFYREGMLSAAPRSSSSSVVVLDLHCV